MFYDCPSRALSLGGVASATQCFSHSCAVVGKGKRRTDRSHPTQPHRTDPLFWIVHRATPVWQGTTCRTHPESCVVGRWARPTLFEAMSGLPLDAARRGALLDRTAVRPRRGLWKQRTLRADARRFRSLPPARAQDSRIETASPRAAPKGNGPSPHDRARGQNKPCSRSPWRRCLEFVRSSLVPFAMPWSPV